MTITQIAELAYVSRSVVSRVINNRPNVSAEARERVKEIVEKYNYAPNPSARRLAARRSKEILLLVPRPDVQVAANGYWHVLFAGISEACYAAGYTLSLTMMSESMIAQFRDRNRAASHYDGYILCGNEMAERALEIFRNRDTSAVLIGGTYSSSGLSYVDVANVDGGRQAVQYLVELGHRRIGVIPGPERSQAVRWRMAGYLRSLRAAQLPVVSDLKVPGDFTEQSGYRAMRRLMRAEKPPTAVFCMSDAMALGAISAAEAHGLSVPDDVSVVGFDDLPFARFTTPPLTTVQLPVHELGCTAGRSVIEHIEGLRSGPVCERLPVKLVVRRSTAGP